jgi:transglutaminase-like putative cysteine protease
LSQFTCPVPVRRPPLRLLVNAAPEAFLAHDDIVDWRAPEVAGLAATFGSGDRREVIGRAYAWVRDRVPHSWDIQSDVVSVSASDCLRKGTGICYAKSHLLAALLRALGVPTGFCYQRVRLAARLPEAEVHVIHALSAVWVDEATGWIRLDARGNKPGVEARFEPPFEVLAFDTALPGEGDYLDLLPAPAAPVVETLRAHQAARTMYLYGLPGDLPGLHFRASSAASVASG